jgi:hypothetical protein
MPVATTNDDKTPELSVINAKDYSFKFYITRYIQEVLEAIITYSLYKLLIDAPINIKKMITICCIIGLFTLLLEEYNPKYKEGVKNGMIVTLGTQLVKS